MDSSEKISIALSALVFAIGLGVVGYAVINLAFWPERMTAVLLFFAIAIWSKYSN